jgi:predicted ArsR family transcriptional regulator
MTLTDALKVATVLSTMPDNEIAFGTKRGAGKTRELVLRWALKGLNGAEIARKVGISRQSANWHLRNLRDSGELPVTKSNGLAKGAR